MQTEEPTPPTLSPRVRIIWLVGVHLFVWLLLGATTALTFSRHNPNLVFFTFMGLVFSQTSLLGIWGGSGTNRWWIRLVGVLVGVGYLGSQSGIWLGAPGLVPLVVAFETLIVSAVLLLARCFGLRTRHTSDQVTPATEMQFSIRHLMILTLAVGCLLALAKWQYGHLSLYGWSKLAIIAAPFATVGLVAVWGVLGAKRPLIGIPVLLVVAVGAAYGLEKSLGSPPLFAALITTMTEAISLAVSLLLVRSWGYRLRRRAAPRPGSDPMEVS
jgi:hypothetical protein